MTISTVPVTGRVLLPDGTAPTNGLLTFTLTGPDTEGTSVLTGDEVQVQLSDGNLPAGFVLWRNSAGGLGTSYRVDLRLQIQRGAVAINRNTMLGYVQLGAAGTYDLGSLLALGIVPPPDPAPVFITTWSRGLLAAEDAVAGAAALVLTATLSGLPAAAPAALGLRALLTDSAVLHSGATTGTVATGGGANIVPVYCDGSAWRIG